MKILYDYQAFYMQRFGGVSNCFVRLIENLPPDACPEIAVRECNNFHLLESQLGCFQPALQTEESFIIKGHFKIKRLLYDYYSHMFPEKTSLGRNLKHSIDALQKNDFNIFHPTFYNPYFMKYLHGRPFVLTVHDMISERFKLRDNKQALWKKELVRHANHIVAVSEQTKNDLMDMMGVPEHKITVIYHGVSSRGKQNKTPLIDTKYILYVGSRADYKNFMLMLEELVPVLRSHQDLSIVCTGPYFTKEEMRLFEQNGIYDRMIHISPNDEGMQNLYEHALCFIFPSLYEGFGIPILEAWQAGCPVLLNQTSCFPEIAQDAAIFFQLNENKSNLATTMEQFLHMGDTDLKELIAKQSRRLENFSWKKSAEKLYEVYERVTKDYYGN